MCQDEMLVEVMQGWIDLDRKLPSLKALQGMIWADGYASGEYQAHVYEDAVAGLRRWHAAGHDLYVYSSGSVAAQKLLFRTQHAGDLSPLFSGWFDTAIGGKRDAGSYRNSGHLAAASGLRDPVPVRRGGESWTRRATPASKTVLLGPPRGLSGAAPGRGHARTPARGILRRHPALSPGLRPGLAPSPSA
jgi:hypothetical protein